MMRSKRLLILLIILGIVCAAAFAALNWQEKKEQIKVSGEPVVEIDSERVQSLSWTYQDQSLSFSKDEKGNWIYDEDAAFPVDPQVIDTLLSSFSPFSAAFVIDQVKDQGQYGLDDPQCVISITTEEKTWEIKLGDTSAVDGQRYVSFGEEIVYLAANDPLDQYDLTLKDCILNDTIPSMDQVTGLAFSGKENYEIYYQENNQTDTYYQEDIYFTRQDGNTRPLDTGRVSSYLSALSNLELTNYVTYNASKEDLAQCGLDKPQLTITASYTSEDEDGKEGPKTFTLHIARDPEELAQTSKNNQASGFSGEASGDEAQEEETITAYAQVENSSIIYSISSLAYTDLMAASYDDLRHQEVLTASFDDILSIDVALEENSYTFTSQGKGSDRTWLWKDQEIDFDQLQEGIKSLSSLSFTDEKPEKQQEIALTIHLDNDVFPQIKIALYRYDGDACLATVDETPVCLVSRNDVVELMEAVRSIVLQ